MDRINESELINAIRMQSIQGNKNLSKPQTMQLPKKTMTGSHLKPLKIARIAFFQCFFLRFPNLQKSVLQLTCCDLESHWDRKCINNLSQDHSYGNG